MTMDYLSVTPKTAAAEQCWHTISVPGLGGSTCCMLSPDHPGPHVFDEAIVRMLISRVNGLKDDRDWLKRERDELADMLRRIESDPLIDREACAELARDALKGKLRSFVRGPSE